jgi:menaquinone-9 beta-reductase
VADQITQEKPASITETVFYSRKGERLHVPSRWLGEGVALGLSRALMDQVLLERARSCGVEVLEGATASDLLMSDGSVVGVRVKSELSETEYRSSLTIDATGRARVLARKIEARRGTRKKKSKLIAFKAHLKNTKVADSTCEIYFYPGGYGGLSTVEASTSNLCFIVPAEDVLRCHSDANRVVREVVMRNPRAAHTLSTMEVSTNWLSASWDEFGQRESSPAPGLLAIGDAAAFIDPFTGSGMLMALESGQLVAETFVRFGNNLRSPEMLGRAYQQAYVEKFGARLRLCRLLRRAAFAPRVVQSAIVAAGKSERLWTWLARSTRSNGLELPRAS